MFEISELTVLARQMNESLRGKTIAKGSLGNSPHKFVWYNRTHEEFASLTQGKVIGAPILLGRWLCLDIEPGYRMVFGELGGKIILRAPRSPIPKKYHLLLEFSDSSFLTVVIGMWGALELYQKGEELNRDYIKDMAKTPLDKDFSRAYFYQLIDEANQKGKRSVKSILTQEQTIPGLGNAVAQDIMFRAGLHPRQNLLELSPADIDALYDAILLVVNNIIDQGGRNDECDLYGNSGSYQRLMDSKSSGKPCPQCGSTIQSMQYLGGACYFCPACQK